MIYFDHAASSWPKPNEVAVAMAEAVTQYGANPGRSGHQLANRAAETIRATRRAVGQLFGIKRAEDVLFFANATTALNQAIKGFTWTLGDEIISTCFEHNSVRRPLEYVSQEYGVIVHYVEPDHNGHVEKQQIEDLIQDRTKLIVTTHMSNVTGAILPIDMLGTVAKENNVPFLVDASQSAGKHVLDVSTMNIDLLAMPGHKGLLGPQGTGILYVAPHLNLLPLHHGGTGTDSANKNQPEQRPWKYESGTLNTPGIAGLQAGVQFLQQEGIAKIAEYEAELTRYALSQLHAASFVRVYGPDQEVPRGPVISFNIENVQAHEVATILDQHYNIAVRAGLHCAPDIHHVLGTEVEGAVRVSFGYTNTQQEIDTFLKAVHEIHDAMSTAF